MYVYICEVAEIAKSLAFSNVFTPCLSVKWNPICPLSSCIPFLDMPNRSRMILDADLNICLLKMQNFHVFDTCILIKICVKYMCMLHFEQEYGQITTWDHSRLIYHVQKWYTHAR